MGLYLIKLVCFGKSGSVFDKVGLFWKKWVSLIKWVCFEKVGLCLIKWVCFGIGGSVFDKVGLF